jgi:cyanophycinase
LIKTIPNKRRRLALVFPLLGAAQQDTRGLVPIGGGYSEETLQGFGSVVADHASGETVDILVVPSSYGDDPADRDENIKLAQERSDQVEAACDVVAQMDCVATLLILFDRNDAENPDNSNALYDAEVDGVFILGGDQTIAMEVLYESPAEVALTDAYQRGVIAAGTSAGAAVESTDMIAGYADPGWPYNALERPMGIVWWENDDTTLRGLIFGSDEIIWDQHFYQRGRFTRLLNITAQSDERYGGASKLGVGVDVDTGVTLTHETLLANIFGSTSAMILDGETAGATFEWVGERSAIALDGRAATYATATTARSPRSTSCSTPSCRATRWSATGRSLLRPWMDGLSRGASPPCAAEESVYS